MMLNRVMLIGNLGRDPEVRTTQAGQKVANLSLATTDRWKDRNSGEWRERTEWHRVVIFNGKLIEHVVEPYLQKGTKLYIEGKIQTRKWQDQSGQDRYTTEIVLQPFDGTILQLGNSATKAAGESTGSAADVLDDEIPF